MATKKATTTRAAKMREYYTANPTATVSQVAKKFKTTYQIAYMCKKGMEQNAVKDAERIYEISKGRKERRMKMLENLPKAPKAKRTPVEDLNTTIWDTPLDTVNPEAITMIEPPNDPVNHPAHYTEHPSGVECIQVTEHMNFCLGNAVKYIWRAELKGRTIEDLEKAIFYVQREINRRKNAQASSST